MIAETSQAGGSCRRPVRLATPSLAGLSGGTPGGHTPILQSTRRETQGTLDIRHALGPFLLTGPPLHLRWIDSFDARL